MYASLLGHQIPIARFFRDAAAACGAALVASWLGLVVVEAIRSDEWIPNIHSYKQAVVLAVVFVSYAIGWQHQLIGAALALAGTAVFFAVSYVDTSILPPLAAIWLAAPGALYLLAWFCGDRRHGIDAWSPRT
jgi:hypothetical protein